MAVVMVNGLDGDFEKATTSYPKDACSWYGDERFIKKAMKCTKQVSVVLKARVAAQCKAVAEDVSSEATAKVASNVATKADVA
jgi:hypothetical protein